MIKRRGGVVLWIVFMAVGLIFTSGAIAVYTVFMKPEKISKVPELTGKSLIEAAAESEKLGLVIQVEPVASTMPDGRVLAQSPEAGTDLRMGQVIVLQVSRSGELHEVPNVKGQSLADAQALIRENGFALGDVIKIREPGIEPGIVIAQSPASPANVNAGRKIDLLVQDGAASDGSVTVPDVNRMTESEARNVLETSGVKVQAVDKVYSPLLPEGLAIETRPAAGSKLKSGEGVILKLATQRRPAGFMDGKSNSNVRRVTTNEEKPKPESKPNTAKAPAQNQNQNQIKPSNRNVTVSVKGEEDVFIGDDYEDLLKNNTTQSKPQTSSRANTPASSQTRTQTASRTNTSTPSQPKAQTQTSAPSQSQSSSGGNKTARIRYIVPPLAQPMNLRIEVTDPSGKRTVMNRQVKSGEGINTSAGYSNECVVTIYLGGESVWQERYR